MQSLNIDLCAELNHMSERHGLFSISDEERLCYERCIFIKYLWLKQSMKIGSLVVSLQVSPTLEMIRIRVVHFLFILVEYLKLEEVDSLLEQVDISEVLHMKHKLSSRSVHFN